MHLTVADASEKITYSGDMLLKITSKHSNEIAHDKWMRYKLITTVAAFSAASALLAFSLLPPSCLARRRT